MRVLVTGAGGFIGGELARHLRARGRVAEVPISALALADRRLAQGAPAGALLLEGDLGSAALLQRVADFGPEVIFHLAAVPGGVRRSWTMHSGGG